MAKRISIILKPAVGKICWHVSVGGCTLPTFSLALGAKIARETPLDNDRQPAVFRDFAPQVSFFVWCVWRLDRSDSIVTSSDGQAREIESGLRRLIGQPLMAVEVKPPAWDLTLSFGDGLRLNVFCDHAGKRPSLDGNWNARVGKTAVYAGAGTKVEIKQRAAVI